MNAMCYRVKKNNLSESVISSPQSKSCLKTNKQIRLVLKMFLN